MHNPEAERRADRLPARTVNLRPVRMTLSAVPTPPEPRSQTERKAHRYFSRAVVVQTGRIDRDRVVTNTRHAAIILLREWPDKACPKRRAAMKRCVEVMRGEKPPSVARRAFVSAAKQVGVLLEA
jgi:hypothetical protein